MLGLSTDIIGIILTVFFGVVGIIGVYYAYRAINRKELAWSPIGNAELLSIDKTVQSDIEVRYRDEPVNNLRLIVIRIQNTGNQSIINPEKFGVERPINISFGENAKILSKETDIVKDKSTDNLDVKMRTEDNRVVVNEVLLQRKNWFDLQIIVADTESYTVDWWIDGIEEVKERPLSPISNFIALISISISISILGLFFAAIGFIGATASNRIIVFFSSFIGLFGLVFFFSFIIFPVMLLINYFTKKQ